MWRYSVLIIPLGLALVPLLLVIPPRTYFFRALNDSAHAVLFFTITLSFLYVFRPTFKSTSTQDAKFEKYLEIANAYGIPIGLSFGLGLGIELIQHFIGRSPSWNDVGLNALGIASALCIYLGFQQTRLGLRILCFGIAILILGYSFKKPASWYYFGHVRNNTMPVVLDFETPEVLNFVGRSGGATISVGKGPQGWPENQSKVLRLGIPAKQKYPGFRLQEVAPDWSGYETLSVDIYSAAPSEQYLNLKLRDKQRIQFTRRFKLQPGLNQLRLALDEVENAHRNVKIDLAAMAYLAIYQSRPKSHSRFYVDNIRLLKTEH